MNVFGIIRITAVVGLSAIKLVSTVLKIKEAKEQGLINPIFVNNNSTPYNCNPVINNACNSTPVITVQPAVWQNNYSESRRFMTNTPCSAPQPVCQAPVSTVTNTVYPTTVQNMMDNVRYDVQSRRYDTTPVCPMVNVNPTYIQPHTLQPTVAQYNYSPIMSDNNNGSMWKSYYGYGYNGYQQPHQMQPYSNQELQWCDKSYGRMMEERQIQQCQRPPINSYGSQIFNWRSPLLRYNGPPNNDSGVVPMFHSPTGTPLFGPSLCIV